MSPVASTGYLPDSYSRRLIIVELSRWNILIRNWRRLVETIQGGRLIGICLSRRLIEYFWRLWC
jgi:hypothetical protein